MIRSIAKIAAGGIFGILLFTFLFYNEPELWLAYRPVILLSGIAGILTTFLLIKASVLIARLTRWQKQPGFSVLISVIVNTPLVFGITAAYLFLIHGRYLDLPVSTGVYIKLSIISFVVVLLYSVTYLVINSYQHLQKSRLDAVQLEARQVDLQLSSLKSQLTPHFLFNSLNTISSLMYKDAGLTEKYVRNLATIYQYTLPTYKKKLVSFEEEWTYVQANIELLKVRFGNALSVELENSISLSEISMPPLTLQLLIENALKHNRINEKDILIIKISRNGNWWQVTNNITEKPNQVTSFNVGLRIIRERYELLGKSVKIFSNDSFTVKLPML